VLASGRVNPAFEPRSGQTKDYKIWYLLLLIHFYLFDTLKHQWLRLMSSALYITDVIFYIASLLGASRNSSLCWFVWRAHFEAATYLIHSGWNLYPETWMYLPGKSQEQDLFHQWMRDICKDAPSLIQLCRGVIRHHFITCTAGREVSSSLSKLEIPRTLKDFLMLKA